MTNIKRTNMKEKVKPFCQICFLSKSKSPKMSFKKQGQL